ncbi:MAG: site-specific integrase [Pseudomonadota bacterium]
MRLYDHRNHRLYINACERRRFIAAANAAPPTQRALCLTLLYTGCRLSEALALTPDALQLGAPLVTFRTLKRRDVQVMREVPIPPVLVDQFLALCATAGEREGTRPLWQQDGTSVNRVTAYRWVKAVMATAGISGAQACPKGLRHGYGIHATLSGVQLHMLAKWMGHASLSTTQIYAAACGPEEQLIAARMWDEGDGVAEAASRRADADRRPCGHEGCGSPPCLPRPSG